MTPPTPLEPVTSNDRASRPPAAVISQDHVAPSLLALFTDQALRTRMIRDARCADGRLDPDAWFPVSAEAGQARREAAAAIAVCTACRVRGQCLDFSLQHWDIGQHGVWGGLVAADRAELRRRLPGWSTGPVRFTLDPAPGLSEVALPVRVGHSDRFALLIVLVKLVGMASPGLRERKKARTRRHIADAAARLFAECGYENVAVIDVAREAEVAEQTVYNYFPTKEQLVTDREEQVEDRLCDLIRSRPAAITSAAAVRDFVLEFVAGIRGTPPEIWRGELGYLAAISPAVHRLALELTDRLAAALAQAIGDTTTVPPEVARLQGIALAGVFQIIISESGRRTREGQSQAEIAGELYLMVGSLLDELDRWFSVSAH